MNEIERQAARAEALGGIVAEPGEEGSHEEQLLRYLGAVYYEARHGRAEPEELERAVSEVDAHVREHGPVTVAAGKRGRAGRRPR